MNSAMDMFGKELIEGSTLTEEEIKTLYQLLNKIDEEVMDRGINWFSLASNEEEEIEEIEEVGLKYYKFAVINFFAILMGDFITKHLGDEVSDIFNEEEHDKLAEDPFIKLLNKYAPGNYDKMIKIMEIMI